MKGLFYTKITTSTSQFVLCFIGIFFMSGTAVADVDTSNTGFIIDSVKTSQRDKANNISLNKQREYIPVDYTSLKISDYKLAVMHVLAEICPSLISAKKRDDFEKIFQLKISSMLPNSTNPQLDLKKMSTKNNYQKIFSSMKKETLNNFSNYENKELCEDFSNNQF